MRSRAAAPGPAGAPAERTRPPACSPVLDRAPPGRRPAARAGRALVQQAAGATAGNPTTRCCRSTSTRLARRSRLLRVPLPWLPALRPQIEAALAQRRHGQAVRARRRASSPPPAGRADRPGPARCTATRPTAWSASSGTAAMIVILARLGNAVERAHGTAGRLPGSPRRKPRPGLVRYRLASKLVKGQPLGGTRRRVGRHRARLPGRRARRATPRRPPRRGTAVRPVRLRRPLPVVPGLGQRPGRAAARPRPDPRRPGDAAGCCGARWRSSWPTGPAACSPQRST